MAACGAPLRPVAACGGLSAPGGGGLDPPYKEKNLFNVLNSIIETGILNTSGIIIIHRHKNDIDKFTDKLRILEDKTYGISRIIFCTYF